MINKAGTLHALCGVQSIISSSFQSLNKEKSREIYMGHNFKPIHSIRDTQHNNETEKNSLWLVC